MPNHLEPARNNWDAILTVPKELRGKYGLPNLRFRKSTGTTDKRLACKIASQYVAGWQILIEQAKGADTSVLSDAMQFRADRENARDAEHRRVLEEVLITHVEGIEKAQGLEKAKEFYAVAQSKQTPSSTYFTQWKTYAEANLKAKTADQWGRDIQEFINQFPTLDTVSTRTVRLWLDKLESKGKGLGRYLSACRNYWKFIQPYEESIAEVEPFRDSLSHKRRKKNKGDAKDAWTKEEVLTLWTEASRAGKQELVDLIVLAAYTGARIEEICSLKVQDVTHDAFNITDAKTKAGIRAIPIHSKIESVVKRLKENSTDGYLLPGLTFNKYGDRSNAIGKRFGTFKTGLGFAKDKSTHSFRHSLITFLDDAGVQLTHIQDIVGHEKAGTTGKVYNKPAPVSVLKVDIEKLVYPLPELI
jgi:integrase